MSRNRTFLWQDVSTVLDDQLVPTAAWEYRTPPEQYLRCNGARFLRVAWELTEVPLGAAGAGLGAMLEFETSDSPEPFNIVGSGSADTSTWARLPIPTPPSPTRAKASGRASFTIDTAGAELPLDAGLHEYVRIRLLNENATETGATWVRLRVWVTLTDC